MLEPSVSIALTVSWFLIVRGGKFRMSVGTLDIGSFVLGVLFIATIGVTAFRMGVWANTI